MLLSEVFDHLSSGEFNQLNIGGSSGNIDQSSYQTLVSYINLALLDLYSKFSLSRKEVIISLDNSIYNYYLHTDYAVSNTSSSEPIKYILDSSEDPFTNNILQILYCKYEDNTEYPLNEDNNELSLYTPNYNTIRVPYLTDREDTLTVVYSEKPITVSYVKLNPAETDIALPYSLLEALLSYVAYKYTLGMYSNEANSTAFTYSRYEAICNKVIENGLVNTINYNITKLDDNGWR